MDANTIFNQVFDKPKVTQPFFTLLVILWLLTAISQLGALAYSTAQSGENFQDVFLQSLIILSLLTIPLCGLGIWLGRQVGLGAPLMAALLAKTPGAKNWLFQDLKLAGILGILMGAILIIIRFFTAPYLPAELPAFGHLGVIGGLLASTGAAIGEEVWFRLGLMTLLLWLITRALGHDEIRPAVAWPVIILAGIGFGLAHLPQLISHGAGSPFAIGGTIIGNTLVGALYGWCYWRRSLIAAMMAHFSVDLVIHVLPAFFS